MTIDQQLKNDLDQMVSENPVVLFMKGTPSAPQCGFSARVCETLDLYLDSYHAVNVLESEQLREGIKVYSDWPTIPQLYVNGEFMGGCDIVQEMADTGQLAEVLGLEQPKAGEPTITISEAAAKKLVDACQAQDGSSIRILVSKNGRCSMALGTKRPQDLQTSANGVDLVLDPFSASRADGLVIDHKRDGFKSGFVLELR